MRLPRVRFTIRQAMIAVVLSGLILAAIVARRERLRKLAAANGAYQRARLTREVAEIAVQEYTSGTRPQDLAAARAQVASAEAELSRAEVRLDRSRRAWEAGEVSAERLASDERALRQAEAALRRAKSQRALLEGDPTARQLGREAAAARADELTKRAAYEQLQASGRGPLW